MIEPLCNRWLYASVLALMAVNIAVVGFTRADLAWHEFATVGLGAAGLGVAVATCRHLAGRAAASDGPLLIALRLFEALLFLQIAWINLRVFNHLSMMVPFPYADPMLSRWDLALGIDWQRYFDWVHAYPLAIDILDRSYSSLTFLSLAALCSLILLDENRRARFFVESFFATALICIVAGAAFPARAAVIEYVGSLENYPNYPATAGIYHMPYLEALRDWGSAVTLIPSQLPGLVTFPSFPTAAGVLLAVAFWRTLFFVPVLAYSTIMIAATPVFGGHYFVDLFAGIAVAMAVTAVLARTGRHRDVFAQDHGAVASPAPA